MQDVSIIFPKPIDEWLPPQLQKPATPQQQIERRMMKKRIKNVLWHQYEWYRHAIEPPPRSRSVLAASIVNKVA